MSRKKVPVKSGAFGLFRNYGRTMRVVFSVGKWSAVGYLIADIVGATFPVLRSWTQGLLINHLGNLVGAGMAAVSRSDWVVFVGFLAASVAPQLSSVIDNYFFWNVWFATGEWVELTFIRARARIDVAMHEDRKISDLANRVSENIGRFPSFADRMFDLMHESVTIILSIGILAVVQWQLFLIILFATIPELIVEMKFGKRIWGIHDTKGESRRQFYDYRSLFSRLSSLIELKLFQNIPYFFNNVRELFVAFQSEQKKAQRVKLLNQLFALIFSQAAIIFAIIVFTRQVLDGSILVGTFIFYLGMIGQFRSSLSNAFRLIGQQYSDSLFVSDMYEYFSLQPKIVSPADGAHVETGTPDILFERVTFSYPGTKKPVLKNFTLHIPSGQRVALVGVNGAGKTTFVKLLCRFYDPDEGRILINGRDLKTLDLESWYQLIGALFQDYTNYHLVVKDAIAIGRSGNAPALEKVVEAAKAAEADVFIQQWERSYKQMLGKSYTDGVEPSMGQWQKLGLARTFYRDPHVMILDEPTSSIDAEAEAKIFEQIDSIHRERTVILISHRFSTVRTADKICVIKNGRIAEYGTHTELMENDKSYARLFRLQAKGYEE